MLKTKCIIFLIFIFIFNSIELWSEPIQKETKPQSESGQLSQQKSANQQNPAKQFVTHQQLFDAITSAIDANNNKHNSAQNPPPPGNSQWWFSFFLMIFTGGLVIVGGFQCYIIFNTLRETQKATMTADKTAGAAIKSANAAEKAVHATRETAKVMRAQDRAYVFVNISLDRSDNDPDEVFRIGKNGLPGANRVNLKIINYGKTPAIIMSVHCKVDFFDSTAEVVNYFDNYLLDSKSIVHPENDVIESGKKKEPPYKIPFYIYNSELDLLRKSKKKLFCVGCISYKDVFQNHRQTIFCWQFNDLFDKFFVSIEYPGYNYRT
jgi:hypothetical protein